MMKYQTANEFRVLVSIEMGMKNHEIVPTTLICSISGLKIGLVNKALRSLHKNKLVHHEAKSYDGFKLTYLGYDFLSLKAMSHRETVSAVGKQIGVGKESDIFLVADQNGEELCLKLHRLGRTSFRAIKNKRDYMKHRKAASWLYMSRLAAIKEYAFMKALYAHDFPVPKPIDHSRHCVLMSLCKGYPMCHVAHVRHPGKVYNELMNLIIRLAQHGLIHCDFNEFNLMIDDEENITMIDFPQMVSTTHENAEFYFDRDVQCIRTYFERRYNFIADYYPKFSDYNDRVYNLDVEVEASGFNKKAEATLEQFINRDETEAGNEADTIELEGNDNISDEEDEEDEQERKDQLKEMRKRILEQQRAENTPERELVSLKRDDTEEKEDLDFILQEGDDSDDEQPSDTKTEAQEGEDIPEDEADEAEEAEEAPKKLKKKKKAQPNADIRYKVKKNLARRNKPKLKPNSNKNRTKRSNRALIKEDRD